jgi:aspartyl-tRNA(Asn)/glutamyl-tRNA(Gln) amidotransferase subunit A
MEVIAGLDAKDATTVPDAVPKYAEAMTVDFKKLRVGLPKEYFEIEGIDPEVKLAMEKKVAWLREQGATIVDVSLPHTKYAIAVYYILVPSEDSSNLARLDGIRYGLRAPEPTLYDTYAVSRAEGFPEEVKRRILIGTYALSAGYYDAYYKKAQAVRTLIIQDFEKVFNEVDVLLTPTSPFPAFGLGEKSADPLALYLADIMVSPGAIAGIPGISIPAGTTTGGLPVGLNSWLHVWPRAPFLLWAVL